METITIYCTNHQCIKNHQCLRYTRHHKLVGSKIVKRFECEKDGYNNFIKK